MKTVLHIVTNDFISDNRVLRAALASCEVYDLVIVFALHRLRRGLSDFENLGNIKVHRLRLTTLKWPKRLPVQLIKYLEAIFRMSREGYKFNPNLIHANDLSGLIIGFVLSKITNAKLLYDSHELQSGTKGILEYPKFITKILLILERFLAKRSNSVITVSHGIAEEMSKRLNISKPRVIRNLPEHAIIKASNISSPLRRAIGLDFDAPIILYQGSIGPGRGLVLLVDAMRQLKNKKAILIFLGNGKLVEKLRERVNSYNLKKRVFFHPAVSSRNLPYWTADATIGVHPMEGICLNHQLALPNKIFEYIQAGLPVLVSNLPEMSKIVHEYGVGEVFADRNVSELAAKINEMLGDTDLMERLKQAAKIASNKLNWEHEQKKLISLYRKLS